MTMGQRIDLKQSQNLVITPQLQQAIKLLQLTNMEINAFIQEELEKNPFLDILIENKDVSKDVKNQVESLDKALSKLEDFQGKAETLDTNYDNVYSEDFGSDSASRNNNDYKNENNHNWERQSSFASYNDEDADYENLISQKISLREHLAKQVEMTFSKTVDCVIAHALVDSLNQNGYLSEDTKDIAERLGVKHNYVLKILDTCQEFDPCGVFARNLKECLELQLKERGKMNDKMQKLIQNLEKLAKRDIEGLMQILNVKLDALQDMIKEIKRLQPKPASEFDDIPIQTVIPDVIIRPSDGGGWSVELNQDNMPRLIINQQYYTNLKKDQNSETKNYAQENFQSANWLLKSLDQRAKTILRVATEIVKQQDGFFAYGVSELRPMNLKLIAQSLGLHESTISRVTANKYIRCPRGLFEMKFFFMSGLAGSDGENNVASEAIRYKIKGYIEKESVKKVLSDDHIVSLLEKERITIARRTVAKYREAMGIPSSVERRRLKKLGM